MSDFPDPPFIYEGVDNVPGEKPQASKKPEATSVSEVSLARDSCHSEYDSVRKAAGNAAQHSQQCRAGSPTWLAAGGFCARRCGRPPSIAATAATAASLSLLTLIAGSTRPGDVPTLHTVAKISQSTDSQPVGILFAFRVQLLDIAGQFDPLFIEIILRRPCIMPKVLRQRSTISFIQPPFFQAGETQTAQFCSIRSGRVPQYNL